MMSPASEYNDFPIHQQYDFNHYQYGSPLNSTKDDKINKEYQMTTLSYVATSIGECSFRCVRSTFILYNFLFWIMGVALILLGLWLRSERDDTAARSYSHMNVSSSYVSGSVYLIAAGSVTTLVTMLACCGACKSNCVMLLSYAALTLTILALEVASICLTFIYRDKIENSLRGDFHRTLNNYAQKDYLSLTKSVDNLQTEFRCCGTDDYRDWFRTRWAQNATHSQPTAASTASDLVLSITNQVPISCCKMPRETGCNKDLKMVDDRINRGGCYEHIRKYLLENLHIISGFGVWVAALETLGIFFSTVLVVKIRIERNNMLESCKELED